MCAAGIAVVPEGRRVFPTMSVRDNLDLGAYHPEATRHRDESYDRVCSIFPRLAERSGYQVGSLSGGEQQMLAIQEIRRAGTAVLLVEQNVVEALDAAGDPAWLTPP